MKPVSLNNSKKSKIFGFEKFYVIFLFYTHILTQRSGVSKLGQIVAQIYALFKHELITSYSVLYTQGRFSLFDCF